MFYRPDTGLTVADLKTRLRERHGNSDTRVIGKDRVNFDFTRQDFPVFRVDNQEVPVTDKGLEAFGSYLSIPSAFLKRLTKSVDLDLQERLLNDLFDRTAGDQVKIETDPQRGVQMVAEPGKFTVQPHRLAEIAARVTTDEATVARLVDESGEFSFDVYVPENFDRGVGGDLAVGDVTAGGIRFGANLKQGLAPWVEEYMFRLRCTNGMGVVDSGLKVDARGQTVDEVLAEVEQMARVAFGRVEQSIQHFYDMRSQRVTNPERAIRTLAVERGLPDRSTMALIDLARGEDLPDEPSMFDVVNLVTNYANSPAVRNDGGRLLLERAGGAAVADSASRCGHCNQKVTAR